MCCGVSRVLHYFLGEQMNRTFTNIHSAYLGALADVYDRPDHKAEPRGQKTREILNYQFSVIHPTVEPIRTHDLERNKIIESYTAKEVELYNSCTNRAEDFGAASKFWLKLANPDGTVNSAYGFLIWKNTSHGSDFETEQVPLISYPEGGVSQSVPKRRTPWDWAKESLIRDKDTRQAILRFSLPEHAWMGVKDFTCTLNGIFLIRENKLNLTISMRSNDLTLGLVYDLPWFVSLMYRMREELLEIYPDLEIGTYTHQVHSLHIYDRDEDKILKMLGR